MLTVSSNVLFVCCKIFLEYPGNANYIKSCSKSMIKLNGDFEVIVFEMHKYRLYGLLIETLTKSSDSI